MESKHYKIGYVLCLGGMTYTFSPVNHSDSSFIIEFIDAGEGREIALAFEYVTLPRRAA